MSALHIETPLLESRPISAGYSGTVWLKMEAMQPSGSFKARGIGFACQKYVEEGAKRLVASSGGNAGVAVAWAGRKLGVPVTVVVPQTTKRQAIEQIALEGAEVIVYGSVWDEAHQHALELGGDDAAYLHPFDDANIWSGHSTLVDEVIADGVTPDAVVLSVGGGGLMCGVLEGLKRNGLAHVPVLAVETEGAASLAASADAGQLTSLERISSIATSLGARQVAQRAFEWLDEANVSCHQVTDLAAIDGCERFLEQHRVLVEPACGASLAALYQHHPLLTDKQNILVVVCGGVGVTPLQLAEWRESLSCI